MEARLESARKVGAHVIIDCSKESLKEAGRFSHWW